jgi:hypothetical protein
MGDVFVAVVAEPNTGPATLPIGEGGTDKGPAASPDMVFTQGGIEMSDKFERARIGRR